MSEYLPEVFLSEEEISQRVGELARAISDDYQGEELVVICVLKGAFIFCSDLIKKIERPVILDFISLSSYGASQESSGEVRVSMDIETQIAGKNVLVVEDIVDSGLTMKVLMPLLQARNPKSLKLASLLFKPARNIHPIKIDYLAFEIEDKFVVGYGLDYAQFYRQLPYIGILNAGN